MPEFFFGRLGLDHSLGRGHPGHCGVLSNIPDLYPLDARSTPSPDNPLLSANSYSVGSDHRECSGDRALSQAPKVGRLAPLPLEHS